MKCIYVDVLIIINTYVNYFTVLAAARLMHNAVSAKRLFLAAFVSGLFSLALLLPEMGVLASLVFKLGGCVTLAARAFGVKKLMRSSALVFLICAIYGGAFYALDLSIGGIEVSAGVLYFDASLLSLGIFTVAAYILTKLYVRMNIRNGLTQRRFNVTVYSGKHAVTMCGIADTGNRLTDPISGRAVIICGKAALSSLSAQEHMLCGYRFIPYKTVSGDAVMPVFRPDAVEISEEESGSSKRVSVLIGLSEENDYAVFNPLLIYSM